MARVNKRKTLRRKKIYRRKRKNTKRNYKKKSGGSNATVGNPYTPDNLPGTSLNSYGGSNANHLPLNSYDKTPFQYMKTENSLIGGGRRKKRRSKKKLRINKKTLKRKYKQKGGVAGISDLYNVGRYMQYESGKTYNELQGYDTPVNPLPWADQYRGTTNKYFSTLA